MTQYIFMSREQDAGPIHDVKVVVSTLKCGRVQAFENGANKSELHT